MWEGGARVKTNIQGSIYGVRLFPRTDNFHIGFQVRVEVRARLIFSHEITTCKNEPSAPYTSRQCFTVTLADVHAVMSTPVH